MATPGQQQASRQTTNDDRLSHTSRQTTNDDRLSHVDAVRRFNRFYTGQIGLLREGMHDSSFSLTEGRVLYELAHRESPAATELAKDLGLDAGYLSRILRRFEKHGLVSRKPSKSDGRRSLLLMTKAGRKAFAPLNRAASDEAAAMLGRLSAAEQDRVVEAMHTIETLIGAGPERETPYRLRSHQSGDMGAIIHLHGVLYAREYGWGEKFEALVAEIAAKFIQNFDPQRERCWVAEKDGSVAGCVFLVKQSDDVAKLRLLIVDPAARGLGIGKHLVAECVNFARQSAYRTITLWTQDVLKAAQHIYEQAGFRRVREEPHCAFGIPMVGQIWELTL
jgi:DNA-binding MarR family transcriptional regulator/N-acetylglutamate synthase-like GNAT family acetyltransferase